MLTKQEWENILDKKIIRNDTYYMLNRILFNNETYEEVKKDLDNHREAYGIKKDIYLVKEQTINKYIEKYNEKLII